MWGKFRTLIGPMLLCHNSWHMNDAYYTLYIVYMYRVNYNIAEQVVALLLCILYVYVKCNN